MRDPRITGISAITGRVVYIRHASAMERELVADKVAEAGSRALDLLTADIVVAREDERLIGFAILEWSEGDEGTPRLTNYEHGRRRGIGGPVLQHLLDHAEVNAVLAGKKSASYLRSAGFRPMKGGTRARDGKYSVRRTGRSPTVAYGRV